MSGIDKAKGEDEVLVEATEKVPAKLSPEEMARQTAENAAAAELMGMENDNEETTDQATGEPTPAELLVAKLEIAQQEYNDILRQQKRLQRDADQASEIDDWEEEGRQQKYRKVKEILEKLDDWGITYDKDPEFGSGSSRIRIGAAFLETNFIRSEDIDRVMAEKIKETAVAAIGNEIKSKLGDAATAEGCLDWVKQELAVVAEKEKKSRQYLSDLSLEDRRQALMAYRDVVTTDGIEGVQKIVAGTDQEYDKLARKSIQRNAEIAKRLAWEEANPEAVAAQDAAEQEAREAAARSEDERRNGYFRHQNSVSPKLEGLDRSLVEAQEVETTQLPAAEKAAQDLRFDGDYSKLSGRKERLDQESKDLKWKLMGVYASAGETWDHFIKRFKTNETLHEDSHRDIKKIEELDKQIMELKVQLQRFDEILTKPAKIKAETESAKLAFDSAKKELEKEEAAARNGPALMKQYEQQFPAYRSATARYDGPYSDLVGAALKLVDSEDTEFRKMLADPAISNTKKVEQLRQKLAEVDETIQNGSGGLARAA